VGLTQKLRGKLLGQRKPCDWARIADALGFTMAAAQSQLRMTQWSPEQREHARLRAKERVARDRLTPLDLEPVEWLRGTSWRA
jgi:hypothetical protein